PLTRNSPSTWWPTTRRTSKSSRSRPRAATMWRASPRTRCRRLRSTCKRRSPWRAANRLRNSRWLASFREKLREACFQFCGKHVEGVVARRFDFRQRLCEGRGREFGDRQDSAPSVGDHEITIVLLLISKTVSCRRRPDHRQPRGDRFRDHRARVLCANDHIGLAKDFRKGARARGAVIDEAGDHGVVLSERRDLV